MNRRSLTSPRRSAEGQIQEQLAAVSQSVRFNLSNLNELHDSTLKFPQFTFSGALNRKLATGLEEVSKTPAPQQQLLFESSLLVVFTDVVVPYLGFFFLLHVVDFYWVLFLIERFK